MKVKFINESINLYLVLNEIYESDLTMDSFHCYHINGTFYPKSWFKII